MEQLQIVFNILSTIVFIYLGLIWTKCDWKNINFKLVCTVLSIVGVIIILANFGYISKV